MAALTRERAFNRELIKKYDVPGPRYTSYPTAPQFRDDFSDADYRGLLERSAASGRHLSLYAHLPFCRTLCFYCGCNVTISRSHDRARRYLELLEKEIAQVAGMLDPESRQVAQIHLGGGTPTFFPPEDLRELMATFERYFKYHPDIEIGVEVDPRTTTTEHLDALAESGVNRLSVGLQDLNPEVQQAVNRVQSAELTRSVIEGAHARGMSSVNMDLIYGLPHQTAESFAQTLDEAVAMRPDRLAVFNFAYLPDLLRHQKVMDPATMPSPEEKLDILETVIDKLEDAGYVLIGMDHFAKPEDPLSKALADHSLTRNFQGYSTWHDTDLVGFGASAIGFVGGGYAQNLKSVGDYEKAIESGGLAVCRGLVMSDDDHLRRDCILRLMSHLELRYADIEARYGIDFKTHFADALEAMKPFAADGLVEVDDEKITVTPSGHLLVRNIAMPFDAYLGHGKATYSRTV